MEPCIWRAGNFYCTYTIYDYIISHIGNFSADCSILQSATQATESVVSLTVLVVLLVLSIINNY